jgi:hypothetical protein
MRPRIAVSVGSLAAAAATTCLVSFVPFVSFVPLAAQAATSAAKPYTPPRMPDGHPNLQGNYDVATMTPVERPPGVTKLVLTKEEAAAMEQYEAQRQVKNDAPLDPNRGAPPVGGENTQPKSYLEFLEKFGGGVVGGYNNFWLAGGTKIITVNGEKRSSIVVDPPDGKIPPMKADAKERNAALRRRTVSPDASESASGQGPAGAFDDVELRPLAERCLLGFNSTSGPPTLPNYFYNNLKQIAQTPTTVMILNEMVHDARVIRIGGEHLPKTIRRWNGDSVGHWEGDTLVVDTTNFTSKTEFQGASENLHIVERFTRVDAKTLLYRFTVEDPTTWERPWTGEYPWVATDEKLYEYACHEGNYSLENMLRGARAKEKEDAEKKTPK